jgi:hypothetical protein
MTEEMLSVLDMEESDLYRRISSEALPECKDVRYPGSTRTLNKRENLILQSFLKKKNLDHLIYHCDTDFHERHFFPPTGYAAICHEDTTFDGRVFEDLFRGFAVCTVLKDGRFKDQEIDRWKAAMNAIIRDDSSNPPIFGETDIDGPWVPSLGQNSWVAIGEKMSTLEKETTVCIYVFCGLPVKSHEHMQRMFYEMRNESFKKAETVYRWYREVSKECRKRILYTLKTAVGLETTAIVDTSCHLYPRQSIPRHIYKWLQACGITNPSLVPSTFVMPTTLPRDCPAFIQPDEDEEIDDDETPEFDRQPHSLIPDLDIFLNDIIPYPHHPKHLLILSGCCALENSVVRVEGPDSQVLIYEAKKGEDSAATSRWLHAFPAQANPRITRPRRIQIDTTWERADQETNVYLSKFGFHFEDKMLEAVDVTVPKITLRPVLIRVTSVSPNYSDCGSKDDEEDDIR